MGDIKSHKDLLVYQKALDFVVAIYKETEMFPESEKFGLIVQLRRAAVSIPSNIAEGAARQGIKEYIHFLYIALGSLSEIETQLEIAYRLRFITDIDNLSKEYLHIRRMLLKLITSLKNKQ